MQPLHSHRSWDLAQHGLAVFRNFEFRAGKQSPQSRHHYKPEDCRCNESYRPKSMSGCTTSTSSAQGTPQQCLEYSSMCVLAPMHMKILLRLSVLEPPFLLLICTSVAFGNLWQFNLIILTGFGRACRHAHALEHVFPYLKPGASVLDVGCGSGVR